MTAFQAVAVACPLCGFVSSGDDAVIVCGNCESRIEATIFPALFRSPESCAQEMVLTDEAACYFHAERVAAFTCTRCGRFLCSLCRIDWSGEDVCASCLEATTKGTEAHTLASDRFHFDSLALTLSTAGILSGFLSVLTAPLALGLAIFTFKNDCSIAPRSKIRFILAMLFSAATIVGWTVFWVYAFRHRGMLPDRQAP